MLSEILKAALFAGIPVAAASYALIWWAVANGHVTASGKVREMEREAKRLSRQKSLEKKRRKAARKAAQAGGQPEFPNPSDVSLTPFHNKWLAFGGGFYGVVGLLTYGVVELLEIRDFLLGFDSLSALFAHFGFNALVGLFVGAVKNFVVAIAWPVYWMSGIRSDHIWLWFLVAYGAYWAGAKYALHRARAGYA